MNKMEIIRYIRMYLQMKLKDEKGEVSVEWALVATIMAVIILAVFYPGVQTMLQNAITNISNDVAAVAKGGGGGGGHGGGGGS